MTVKYRVAIERYFKCKGHYFSKYQVVPKKFNTYQMALDYICVHFGKVIEYPSGAYGLFDKCQYDFKKHEVSTSPTIWIIKKQEVK